MMDIDKDEAVKYLKGEIDILPYIPKQNFRFPLSPYCMTAINEYRIEYDAEYYRMELCPKFPSRLSAIYAFDSYETCKTVSQKHGWNINEVREFKVKAEHLISVVKVNMEIISLLKHAYKVSHLSEQSLRNIWKSYWSGVGNIQMELPVVDGDRTLCDSGIIWEYLIEGTLVAV